MTGVQAHAEHLDGEARLVDARAELLEVGAERPAGAGGVLEQQPSRLRCRTGELERPVGGLGDAAGRGRGISVRVAADVGHDAGGSQHRGAHQLVGECGDRLLAQHRLRCGGVDEVGGVSEERAKAGCGARRDERLGLRGVDGRPLPLPRALREYLRALGADLQGVLQSVLVAARD